MKSVGLVGIFLIMLFGFANGLNAFFFKIQNSQLTRFQKVTTDSILFQLQLKTYDDYLSKDTVKADSIFKILQ